MEDTIIKYIHNLDRTKRAKILSFLKARLDPSNDKLYVELLNKDFDFEELRRLQSELFNLLINEDVIKNILLKM